MVMAVWSSTLLKISDIRVSVGMIVLLINPEYP